MARCRASLRWATLLAAMALVAVLQPPAFTQQQQTAHWRVTEAAAGFASEDGRILKTGMWAPVHITLARVQSGRGSFVVPADAGQHLVGKAVVSTADADANLADYTVPFLFNPTGSERILAYARPTGLYPTIEYKVSFGFQSHANSLSDVESIRIGEHLYLVLGGRGKSLRDAMVALASDRKANRPAPRNVAYIDDAERLPDRWFGYEAADLVILLTSRAKFLDAIRRDPRRLAALADWVRQGGHLIVSISYRNRERVHDLLTRQDAWRPQLPPVFVRPATKSLAAAPSVVNWARAGEFLFPPKNVGKLDIVALRSTPTVETLIDESTTGDPLMLRCPYGRGSVTLVAFELDRSPFLEWQGKDKFWQTLVRRIGPKLGAKVGGDDNAWENRIARQTSDITSQLNRELDDFAISRIPFGLIALFLLLYILVVGPLDYLLLRFVFRRLELTWITFPLIVVAITVAAYFTAYAINGERMQINKVDLVDLDLRTDLDGEYRTRTTQVLGTTWFSILSPQIQNYTIGLEPVIGEWLNKKIRSEVSLAWMGRPEEYGPGAIGRGGAGIFQRAYSYAPDARGLIGVPIPVWSTKAFTATWFARTGDPLIRADLTYDLNNVTAQNLSGTIQSRLPEPLEDCYLFYGRKYYALEEPIEGGQGGRPVNISINGNVVRGLQPGRGVERWSEEVRFLDEKGFFSDGIVQQYFFASKQVNAMRNNQHGNLDQSWRVRANRRDDSRSVRTAILVGRWQRRTGDAESLNTAADVATRLWLGTLPGQGTRPALNGTMTQDVYFRVILPVRPKER